SPFYQQIASTWETTFIGTDDAQTRSLLHQYRLGKSILLPHRGLLFYRRYVSLKLMELALTHDYDVWIGGGIYSFPVHAVAPLVKVRGRKLVLLCEEWQRPRGLEVTLGWPYIRWIVRTADRLAALGAKQREFYQ